MFTSFFWWLSWLYGTLHLLILFSDAWTLIADEFTFAHSMYWVCMSYVFNLKKRNSRELGNYEGGASFKTILRLLLCSITSSSCARWWVETHLYVIIIKYQNDLRLVSHSSSRWCCAGRGGPMKFSIIVPLALPFLLCTGTQCSEITQICKRQT